jgi:glutamate synthase (ferredoxin)
MNGDSPFKAMMMVMPEAFNNQPDIVDKPEIVNFYEFYGGHMESWDGPANVTFSDGNYVGANLDRNGLRPARFEITDDGFIYFGSEVGNNQLDQSKIIEKGRLGPGQMFAVDLKTGELLYNWDIKQKVASEFPYGMWLKENRVLIKENKNFIDETTIEAGEAL